MSGVPSATHQPSDGMVDESGAALKWTKEHMQMLVEIGYLRKRRRHTKEHW